MSFKEILAGLCQRIEGALAASLIGLDGIAIETVNDHRLPLEIIGAEFGGFIKSVRPNEELNTGEVRQFTLMTERYTTILSGVTSEYFILLILRPDGNYGRARFELEKVKEQLRADLQ